MMTENLFAIGLLFVLSACAADDHATGTESAYVPVDSTRTVVDSVFPVEEEIGRFKSARRASASALTGASTSRDALVARFLKAVAAHDTADIRRMVLNAAEFIDLYYPTSMFARPPYKQSPELRWFLMQENSTKGIVRLLSRSGKQPVQLTHYQCASDPVIEGENKMWDRCVVSWNQQSSPIRIFSTIIERDGRFKFMSYANDL